MAKVIVFGGINMDLFAYIPRSTREGETITASSIEFYLGGKGANQAVAASRLGAEVAFVGTVGKDEFGEKFNARSNVACAVHKARLWFPTAFTPYSTNSVDNRIWKPQGVFARPDSYTMFIMDRWGQEVFKTNNIDQGWDGKINGKDALMGVYTYYVKYRSIEDVPIEERGNFTLLY